MRELRPAVVGVVLAALVAAFWLTRADTGADVSGAGPGRLLPHVGEPAPPLVVQTVSGDTIDLRDLRGRPVWVTFGASWCPPCRAEAPDIEATSAAHDADGLVVVAIYLGEEAEPVAAFTQRLGLGYAAVPDPDRLLGGLYGVHGLPSHYFIGRDGALASVAMSSLSREQMESEVRALLG